MSMVKVHIKNNRWAEGSFPNTPEGEEVNPPPSGDGSSGGDGGGGAGGGEKRKRTE